MDVKRLKYYCTIVEQGQINRAAKILHISQSPLCQRLKELEDELGTVLIARGRGQWEVTEAGRILYEESKALLEGLGNLKSQIESIGRDNVSGEIHIGVSPMCQSQLLGVLHEVSNANNLLHLRITVVDSSMLEERVANGSLDIGLQVLPLHSEMCEAMPLPSTRFCAVFSNRFPVTDTDTVSIKKLGTIPLVVTRRRAGSGLYERLMKEFETRGISPTVILDSENVQMLLRLVEEGIHACAIVPASEFSKQAFPDLRRAVIEDADIEITPTVIVKKHRYKTHAMRAVLDEICHSQPQQSI